MLAYLNSYIILADTNVWINWKFRAAVKKSTVLQRQLRVPHLVEDELKKKQEKDPELGKAAKDALKIIEKHEIRILDDTHLSFHHADPEFILYGMENAGDAVAVVTADNDLRDDLKALCPGVLILGWDIDAGQFALEGKPEYLMLAKQYGKIIASSRAAGRKDFAVLAVMLGGELVETPSGTCSAGESASLLARVVLHRGKQRALLLLAEGEDTLPYMGHRDTKLKSVDNAGFDVAVMDAAGRITVLKPKGKPLPCSKQQKAVPKPKAKATPAPKPKAKAVPAAKQAPAEAAEEYPHSKEIRHALEEKNFSKAQPRMEKSLKDCLDSGAFPKINKILDDCEEYGQELPLCIIRHYVAKTLPDIKKRDIAQLMARFTGKVGKELFCRLIKLTTGSKAAGIITPPLNAWKKLESTTDAQRKAIDAIIQYANEKK
ncbi:MAG: hypothetical protein Q4C88_07300 [Akkermansia sp.]|nr:hypothetical protein [Akkermansia sp.]